MERGGPKNERFNELIEFYEKNSQTMLNQLTLSNYIVS